MLFFYLSDYDHLDPCCSSVLVGNDRDLGRCWALEPAENELTFYDCIKRRLIVQKSATENITKALLISVYKALSHDYHWTSNKSCSFVLLTPTPLPAAGTLPLAPPELVDGNVEGTSAGKDGA